MYNYAIKVLEADLLCLEYEIKNIDSMFVCTKVETYRNRRVEELKNAIKVLKNCEE